MLQWGHMPGINKPVNEPGRFLLALLLHKMAGGERGGGNTSGGGNGHFRLWRMAQEYYPQQDTSFGTDYSTVPHPRTSRDDGCISGTGAKQRGQLDMPFRGGDLCSHTGSGKSQTLQFDQNATEYNTVPYLNVLENRSEVPLPDGFYDVIGTPMLPAGVPSATKPIRGLPHPDQDPGIPYAGPLK